MFSSSQDRELSRKRSFQKAAMKTKTILDYMRRFHDFRKSREYLISLKPFRPNYPLMETDDSIFSDVNGTQAAFLIVAVSH